ncbi:MAG TPA: M56 family metallopeptidase [Caulobacteraceae bacterium]|nr:M56 family metallopeptidase [Caulobacteraceae bacterium]
MPHALIDYLVNAVWQVPLVAIGAAILVRIGGFGPRIQHAIWLGALGLAVSLPLLPALAPLLAAPAAPADLSPGELAAAVAAAHTVAVRPALLPPIELDAGAARLVALAFLAVIGTCLARLIVSWRAAGALVGRSRPAALAPAVDEALRRFARAHGAKAPPVRISEEVRGPVVAGALWPVILVPRAFSRLPQEDQRAALLHEAAHVVRRDFAVNLACEAAAAPIAWHPVTHEIRAGARQSRELACDALASAAMASPTAYARSLLNLAAALKLNAPGESSAVLVGLFGRGDLEDRLMHLIKTPARQGMGRLLVGAAAACAILAPAVLLRVTPAYAQDVAPPEAPAAPPVDAAPEAPPAPPAVSEPRQGHYYARHRYEAARRPMAGDPPAPPRPPYVDERRIEAAVRDAVARAHIAEQVLASAEVQKAMAEARAELAHARAQQMALSAEERERIRDAARQAAEAWKSAHLEETLAQVRRQLNSPEMRRALDEAVRAGMEAPPIPPVPPAPPPPPPPPPPPGF